MSMSPNDGEMSWAEMIAQPEGPIPEGQREFDVTLRAPAKRISEYLYSDAPMEPVLTVDAGNHLETYMVMGNMRSGVDGVRHARGDQSFVVYNDHGQHMINVMPPVRGKVIWVQAWSCGYGEKMITIRTRATEAPDARELARRAYQEAIEECREQSTRGFWWWQKEEREQSVAKVERWINELLDTAVEIAPVEAARPTFQPTTPTIYVDAAGNADVSEMIARSSAGSPSAQELPQQVLCFWELFDREFEAEKGTYSDRHVRVEVRKMMEPARTLASLKAIARHVRVSLHSDTARTLRLTAQELDDVVKHLIGLLEIAEAS